MYNDRRDHNRNERQGGERRGDDRQSGSNGPQSEGQAYIVGRRAALELLKTEEGRAKVEKIYLAHGVLGTQITEILHQSRKFKLAVGELDRHKFRELEQRVSRSTDSQGVILLTTSRGYQQLEDVLGSPHSEHPPLLIALDGVEDPHNMGAIIRSAEAAGSDAVLLPQRGAVLTPAVYKTSAGAAATIAIVKYGNLNQTIQRLQEEFGVRVVGLAGEGEKTIYEADLTGPICLVTGSEEKGLHRLTRERCDELIKIPLRGQTASLNASVATAVALFETVRQRTKV